MTALRATIRYEHHGHSDATDRPTRLCDAIADFAAWLRDQGHMFTPVMVYDYMLHLDLFVRWFQVSKDKSYMATSITIADVDQYRLHLQAVRRFKPQTVARRLDALRVFFDWAVDEGLLATSPVRAYPIEVLPVAPTSIGDQTFQTLLTTAQKYGGPKDVAILQLLRHTGIRISQLCALRLRDVTLTDDHGQLTIGGGSKEQSRTVSLNADVQRALCDYLAIRPITNDSRIFVGQNRKALTYQAVRSLILEVGRRAGFDQVTARILRRTLGPDQIDYDVMPITD